MKWLQGMVVPTFTLWLIMIASGGAAGLHPERESMSPRAGMLGKAALSIAIAAWVMADARKRGRKLCYDFDSMLYFAWSVMVPIYLFQTRGLRAFLTLLCFGGLCLMMLLAEIAMSFFVLWLRGDGM